MSYKRTAAGAVVLLAPAKSRRSRSEAPGRLGLLFARDAAGHELARFHA